MEYKIDKISEKKHSISEEESTIIKRAIPFYKNTLERYEKMLFELKSEIDKDKEKPKTLNDINPFDITNFSSSLNIPSIDEIKSFIYSAWAKVIADVQTPYIISGQKKKGIVKRLFREVQKGKYINKDVRDIMNEFVSKMEKSLELK